MRKPTAIIGIVSLLLGLAALLGAPVLADAQDEIKLGAFLPISGISADVGAQMKAGTEVAAERMATLQVGGKPMKVHVIWYDDEGKGDVGLNVVTRALTVDKINVGMGFLSSDVFIRVMDEFQKTSTPIVTCCSASLKIGEKIAQNKMQYAFQLSPTANDIARSLTAAVAMHVKPKKIALLNENTDAGRDFSRIVREWFAANAKDVEVVADEFVDRGVTDLTPQFAKIKRSGAQAIIGEIYGSSGSVLFSQWYELKVPAVIAHMGATVSAQTFIDQYVKQYHWSKYFPPGAMAQFRWTPDGNTYGKGNVYGVGQFGQSVGVFFNKAKLRHAGLNPNKLPTTFAGFNKLLAQLRPKVPSSQPLRFDDGEVGLEYLIGLLMDRRADERISLVEMVPTHCEAPQCFFLLEDFCR